MPSEYTLIRGKCWLRLSYPSRSKSPKIRLPRREESSEESTESTARRGEHSSITLNQENDQNDEDGRDEIVIHLETGEPFNKRTQEFEW
jgi:hypothetical protein